MPAAALGAEGAPYGCGKKWARRASGFAESPEHD
jgi:hypothetical protein